MKTEYRDAVSFVNYTSLLPKLVECWANSLRCQIRTDLYECGGAKLYVVIILKSLAMRLINVFSGRIRRVTSVQ
jgi:hypothetical protein